MRSSAVETSDIYAQEPKSRAAQRLGKLCTMLRSTLRSFPRAKLLHGKGGFGASLEDGTLLYIRYSGQLSPADLRDLLALFATWLAVDPGRLVEDEATEFSGVSRMANEESYYSHGRLD